MYGLYIYNAGMKTKKFKEINSMYIQSAKRKNIQLKPVSNFDIYMDISNSRLNLFYKYEKPEFILFMDKDINLALSLEKMGFKVFNSSEAIRICDSKILSYLKLSGNNIRMPRTIIAPFCYYEMQIDLEFIKYIETNLSYPLILKQAYGSFGKQVYMIKNREQLIQKIKELKNAPHLYQEFIKSSFGRDIRVNVVGNRVVSSMYRQSDDDFRSNISSGGKMKKINLPYSFEKMALDVAKIIGVDFAGVDLMFSEDDEPIFCEINSNAHIKNIYNLTGINVADYIFDYIKEKVN